MRFTTAVQIDELVAHRVVESASLEYKRELHLDQRSERSEVLKDLTGMGNGGGGTILYGIAEDDATESPAADHVSPLSDFSLQAKLENIIRDGVHPPLLVEYSPIEVDDGLILAVDIRRSPVGPYMVEAYGDRRYYRRVGSNVFRMAEQEIRDAYSLAMRVIERRPQLWAEHGLPMPAPTNDLWLVVSALPEEPLTDVLDMRGATPADFIPPESMMTYVNNHALGDLTPTLQSLTRWAGGFHGDDADARSPFDHALRVHRDGAAVLATRLSRIEEAATPVWTTRVFRVLNTALLY